MHLIGEEEKIVKVQHSFDEPKAEQHKGLNEIQNEKMHKIELLAGMTESERRKRINIKQKLLE